MTACIGDLVLLKCLLNSGLTSHYASRPLLYFVCRGWQGKSIQCAELGGWRQVEGWKTFSHCKVPRYAGAWHPPWRDYIDWYEWTAAPGFRYLSGDPWRFCRSNDNPEAVIWTGSDMSFQCVDIPGAHACAMTQRNLDAGAAFSNVPSRGPAAWETGRGFVRFTYTSDWPLDATLRGYRPAVMAAGKVVMEINGQKPKFSVDTVRTSLPNGKVVLRAEITGELRAST